jgi:hypothetical protein
MEDFAKSLLHVAAFKKDGQWNSAAQIIGRRLKVLLGADYDALTKLTEVEMLAGIVKQGANVWVPYKLIMLIALLKEAGDLARVRYPPHGGHGWYLKALHLLLDGLAHSDVQANSELLPTIEELLCALGESCLPVGTRLLLVREYERRGCFDRAKDQFRAVLQRSPKNPKLLNFGIALFERLLGENDATLAGGGLKRSELQAIIEVLVRQKAEIEDH